MKNTTKRGRKKENSSSKTTNGSKQESSLKKSRAASELPPAVSLPAIVGAVPAVMAAVAPAHGPVVTLFAALAAAAVTSKDWIELFIWNEKIL